MNTTQKYIFEIPFLIFIIWLWQSLELSLFRLPFNAGSLQLIPILVTYIALTRSWALTTLLSALLLLAQSFNSGISPHLFLAIGLWCALFTKLFALEFTVEGRQQFVLLSGGAHVANKIALYFFLRLEDNALPLASQLKGLFLSSLGAMALAYFVFPFLVRWDEYFEHQLIDSRDLNPDVLR